MLSKIIALEKMFSIIEAASSSCKFLEEELKIELAPTKNL
jgi:hypothetical protein